MVSNWIHIGHGCSCSQSDFGYGMVEGIELVLGYIFLLNACQCVLQRAKKATLGLNHKVKTPALDTTLLLAFKFESILRATIADSCSLYIA